MDITVPTFSLDESLANNLRLAAFGMLALVSCFGYATVRAAARRPWALWPCAAAGLAALVGFFWVAEYASGHPERSTTDPGATVWRYEAADVYSHLRSAGIVGVGDSVRGVQGQDPWSFTVSSIGNSGRMSTCSVTVGAATRSGAAVETDCKATTFKPATLPSAYSRDLPEGWTSQGYAPKGMSAEYFLALGPAGQLRLCRTWPLLGADTHAMSCDDGAGTQVFVGRATP